MVLKIWDLGLGFGIHLRKIRDLGSRDPRLPTPGLNAPESYLCSKQKIENAIFIPGQALSLHDRRFVSIFEGHSSLPQRPF